MALASAVCWVAVSTAAGEASRGAVLVGAAGPFAVAAGAWLLIERAHRRAPEQVSALMIKLFAAKMIVFAAYVAVAVIAVGADAVPFVIGFASTFIVLHALLAFYLRRLFAGGTASGLIR
jgi:hypothetical protein